MVIGAPIGLNRIMKINKPSTRVHCDLQEIGHPDLTDVLGEFVKRQDLSLV